MGLRISLKKMRQSPILLFCRGFASNFHKDSTFTPGQQQERVNTAVFLFREMLQTNPQQFRVDEFTKLFNLVVDSKRYSVALHMFDEMRQWGVVPVLDEHLMDTVIRCYCRLNEVESGLAVMGTFFKCGYEPGLAAFRALVEGLFLGGKTAEARAMFEKFAALNVCEPEPEPEPDTVIVNIVIKGLFRAGESPTDAVYMLAFLNRSIFKPSCASSRERDDRDLKLLLESINKGVSPDAVSYTSMFQRLSDDCRWKDIKRLLQRMVDHDISLDESIFNGLVDALWEKGVVVEEDDDVLVTYVRPDALPKFGMGIGMGIREAKDALEIIMQENVRPDVVDINTCDAMIHGYSMLGCLDKAKEVFDSMENKCIRPFILSYGCLIYEYCKKGDVDEAWRLFLQVPSKGLRHTLFTYNVMIDGLCCEGRFDDGWKLFEEMEIEPSLDTHNILLDGLCWTQRTDEAVSFVSMMEDTGVYPNQRSYWILIHGLCNHGKLDVALNILDQLPSKGLQPHVGLYNMVLDSSLSKRIRRGGQIFAY